MFCTTKSRAGTYPQKYIILLASYPTYLGNVQNLQLRWKRLQQRQLVAGDVEHNNVVHPANAVVNRLETKRNAMMTWHAFIPKFADCPRERNAASVAATAKASARQVQRFLLPLCI